MEGETGKERVKLQDEEESHEQFSLVKVKVLLSRGQRNGAWHCRASSCTPRIHNLESFLRADACNLSSWVVHGTFFSLKICNKVGLLISNSLLSEIGMFVLAANLNLSLDNEGAITYNIFWSSQNWVLLNSKTNYGRINQVKERTPQVYKGREPLLYSIRSTMQ
ncbi:hypothetical protein Y1Q_0020855 [Alligator mississippiensis]|uniref:Uncharacterized protein n=1 Tax=Alligator mississippiensis TaxID=8496 RepID=A0A151NJ43_ALLMI|nr:hypothetical protein Y1Q_0020855 [Alligator mississippiensis]